MSRPSAARIAPGLFQLLPLSYGSMARSRRDPLGFLAEGRRLHGDVFRYQLGPLVFHQLAHPDHVQHVLLDHQRNYPRSWYYGRLKAVVGEGLVTTEGASWRRLRRIAQPAFDHRRIAALAGAITDATEALRRRWETHAGGGTPLDVAAEFVALTLRIVGRALLGVELGGVADRLGPALTTGLECGEHRVANLIALPPCVPTPKNLRFRRALRAIDAVIFDLIARRRAAPDQDAEDLLSILLATRDPETGEGLTDRELRDQVFTFLAAGHETTALALTWTMFLLHEHPEADRRLRAEVAEVLDGRTPGASDVPRLPYTRRVIEESLRLYPPAYAVARDVREEDEIGGYRIPARSMIILSPYVTQRHPDFWPDPDAFDPDRFTPERSVGRPRFAWYPFLGGPHRCIGQEFALMELTLIVAMLAQSFRLRLVPGTRVVPQPMLSLRPRDGLPMTVHPS